MTDNPNEPTFEVDGYERMFPREQIETMLRETLAIVAAVDPPAELARDVFGVAHGMVSTVTPKDNGIVKAAPRMAIPRGQG